MKLLLDFISLTTTIEKVGRLDVPKMFFTAYTGFGKLIMKKKTQKEANKKIICRNCIVSSNGWSVCERERVRKGVSVSE